MGVLRVHCPDTSHFSVTFASICDEYMILKCMYMAFPMVCLFVNNQIYM